MEAETFKIFKPFVEVDMLDPKFATGQLFESTDILIKTIREHNCKHRKNINSQRMTRQEC